MRPATVGDADGQFRPAGCHPAGRSAARGLVRVGGSALAGEVGVDAGWVGGSAGELVLETGPGQAAIAGSAQAAAQDALGDGPSMPARIR